MPASAHVLIIDDDPAIRAVLAALLADEGCRVSAPAFAPRGLADLAALAPGLIILDHVGVAEGGGWEPLERLRADPGFAAVPVLLRTAAAAMMGERTAQLAALNARLAPKPFAIDDLLAALNVLLAAAQDPPRIAGPAGA